MNNTPFIPPYTSMPFKYMQMVIYGQGLYEMPAQEHGVKIELEQ